MTERLPWRDALRWYRATYRQRLRAEWSLRRVAQRGPRSVVLGKPIVDATDLHVGADFKVWSGPRTTLISGWGRMRIGDRVFVNAGTTIIAVEEITIGDDVAFGTEVYVIDSDSHGTEGRPHRQAPVRIGSGSWLCSRSMVLPGVTIGSRVVVAAGAVVVEDVPDDCMVAGNPGRVVKKLVYPDGCLRAWHDDYCACPQRAEVAARLREDQG